MSSKINVTGIISGHVETLVNSSTGKVSIGDHLTFFGAPLIVASLSLLLGFNLSDTTNSLLVNFGAIFTALLLSVLILVYDQESKLEEQRKHGLEGVLYLAKKTLLSHLYYNISYAIVCAIALVVACLSHSALQEASLDLPWTEFTLNYGSHIITPVAAFLATNLLLTILMIVKRMHALLTTST